MSFFCVFSFFCDDSFSSSLLAPISHDTFAYTCTHTRMLSLCWWVFLTRWIILRCCFWLWAYPFCSWLFDSCDSVVHFDLLFVPLQWRFLCFLFFALFFLIFCLMFEAIMVSLISGIFAHLESSFSLSLGHWYSLFLSLMIMIVDSFIDLFVIGWSIDPVFGSRWTYP